MPIYMRYEGIEGPGVGKYKGWIELDTAQLGVQRPSSQKNREASAPSVSEIVITKSQDSASNALFRASINGEGKKVTIDFVDSKHPSAPYMSIELQDCMISGFSISGHGGDS